MRAVAQGVARHRLVLRAKLGLEIGHFRGKKGQMKKKRKKKKEERKKKKNLKVERER